MPRQKDTDPILSHMVGVLGLSGIPEGEEFELMFGVLLHDTSRALPHEALMVSLARFIGFSVKNFTDLDPSSEQITLGLINQAMTEGLIEYRRGGYRLRENIIDWESHEIKSLTDQLR